MKCIICFFLRNSKNSKFRCSKSLRSIHTIYRIFLVLTINITFSSCWDSGFTLGAQTPQTQCNGINDCEDGYYCSGCLWGEPCLGKCYQGGCSDSSECNGNQYCRHGICFETCKSNNDCANSKESSVCIGYTLNRNPPGDCRRKCIKDADCDGYFEEKCTCGACSRSCNSDSNCPENNFCKATPGCETGICLLVRTTCNINEHCDAGYRCQLGYYSRECVKINE
jgi:hypothetical protein